MKFIVLLALLFLIPIGSWAECINLSGTYDCSPQTDDSQANDLNDLFEVRVSQNTNENGFHEFHIQTTRLVSVVLSRLRDGMEAIKKKRGTENISYIADASFHPLKTGNAHFLETRNKHYTAICHHKRLRIMTFKDSTGYEMASLIKVIDMFFNENGDLIFDSTTAKEAIKRERNGQEMEISPKSICRRI